MLLTTVMSASVSVLRLLPIGVSSRSARTGSSSWTSSSSTTASGSGSGSGSGSQIGWSSSSGSKTGASTCVCLTTAGSTSGGRTFFVFLLGSASATGPRSDAITLEIDAPVSSITLTNIRKTKIRCAPIVEKSVFVTQKSDSPTRPP